MKSSKPKPHSDEFHFAVLASDIAVFRIINDSLHVLLGALSNNNYDSKWGLIGGIINVDETAEEATDRLLKEKAGISNIYKEQLYTFSSIDRDVKGRVISVAYIALAGNDPQDLMTKGETKWVPADNVPKLAYDHDEILAVALDRLRGKIVYTNIAQYLLPEEFTLSELQKTYEVVIGEKLDKRNFRKKISASGIVKDTKRTKKQGVMRPASLYRFTSKKQQVVQIG